jgi:uncharacterized protein involved in exopolysaccharide biosynthesis
MEANNNQKQKYIDISKIAALVWEKRKTFVKVWVVTFILSCIWILPQPRYYVCEVKLAPEMNGTEVSGGLSSIASSFGVNLDGLGGNDAIYPTLYPDLFQSPEFTTELFDIQVKTIDESVCTDYYTYLSNHQKKNPLTQPVLRFLGWLKSLSEKPSKDVESGHNPFRLSKKEQGIMFKIQKSILCSVDKRTDVISISVKDQDALVCATMADSVMTHLQNFITNYRTKKARLDLEYYQHLTDSARIEYIEAQNRYSDYCDAHNNILLQASISQRDRLENELSMKLNTYQAMLTQLQATKAKVQEKTPAFTTLQSATVPLKPAGPKRMIFVAAMLIFSTLVTSVMICRKYLIAFL